MARGVGRLTEHSFLEGKGSYITTTKGETFLDLTCGIGVTNLGHCHPKITEATQKQCAQLVHAQVSTARYADAEEGEGRAEDSSADSTLS